MARGSQSLAGEEVREESSWRYPLMILGATLVLCVIFLYHYVGPDVEEIQGNRPRPTISDERIPLVVGDMTFAVPANYTIFPRDRRPGERDTLSLYASWPRMEGYVPARKDDFVENAPDSRRIDILLLRRLTPFTEPQRLETLYMPHTLDKDGETHEHGLTRYNFRQGTALAPASGYSDKIMFLGEDLNGDTAVIFCYPEGKNFLAECFREFEISDQVASRYYFKRLYLPEWQRIDERVRELVIGFTEDSAR